MGIYFKPKDVGRTKLLKFEANRTSDALIRLPNPKALYSSRIVRFKHLAENHPMREFLQFCMKITELQCRLLSDQPVSAVVEKTNLQSVHPLYIGNYLLSPHWQSYLMFIISELGTYPAGIKETCEKLSNMTTEQRDAIALHLLHGNISQRDPLESLLIWSALSSVYIQLAAQFPLEAKADHNHERHFCPLCRSYPVASLIPHSDHQLRYLHCSLCETQWHSVRLQCTNCNDLSKLNFYSLDEPLSSIKTECCSECSSYLKIFYSERDPKLDIIADDLASLVLDKMVEDIGFNKTGLNPYLFCNMKVTHYN